MKNPLVDALRQALDETAPSDQTLTPVVKDSPIDADENHSRSSVEDFGLLETGIHEIGQLSATAAAEDSDVATQAAVEVPDTVAADQTDSFAATTALRAQRVVLEQRPPRIVTIGRVCPLICLFAVLASAGGYVLTSNLTAMNLNEDLADMSARSPLPTDVQVADDDLLRSGVSVVTAYSGTAARYGSSLAVSAPPARTPGQLSTPSSSPLPEQVSTIESGARVDLPLQPIVDKAHELTLRAYAAYQKRDYESAEKHYLQALAVAPNNSDALAGIAAVYVQTGQKEQAERAYEKLLALEPANATAVAGIWSLRSADSDWDAESELKHLLHRFSTAPHLHFVLGKIYVEQGRWPDAKHEFLAAHQMAPDNADYSYNAAVSMEKMGEQQAARRYYSAALAAADSDSNVDRIAIAAHLDDLAMERL